MSPSLFKIMASNLLGNAVSYAPHNGQIEIAVEREAGMLVISISNSNPGVSERDLGFLDSAAIGHIVYSFLG